MIKLGRYICTYVPILQQKVSHLNFHLTYNSSALAGSTFGAVTMSYVISGTGCIYIFGFDMLAKVSKDIPDNPTR